MPAGGRRPPTPPVGRSGAGTPRPDGPLVLRRPGPKDPGLRRKRPPAQGRGVPAIQREEGVPREDGPGVDAGGPEGVGRGRQGGGTHCLLR